MFSSNKSYRNIIILFEWKHKQSINFNKIDLRKYLNLYVIFLFSFFVLYSLQQTDLSNPLLRSFDNLLLSFADKVTTVTYNFVSSAVKIMLLGLTFVLSAPAADRTQYFAVISSNSALQLINEISSDLQKLLKYFNGTAIVAFSESYSFYL